MTERKGNEMSGGLIVNSRATFVRVFGPLDWYFRVRGYGLSVERLKHHRPLFSERMGHRKTHHVAGLCIEVLRPRPARTSETA